MWINIQIFGFRALWSPYYFLFVLGLAFLYFLITGPLRSKFGNHQPPTIGQQVFFYIGMVLLYIIKGSPIDLISHIMFTSHMVQMALYYLVFPIFIIKGIPVWIWKKVMYASFIGPILRFLTKPLLALILFNGLFSFYHIPAIFDFAKANVFWHAVISTVILISAFCMWWPVFTPLKELDKLSPIMKIGYIFANGVLITPACGLIIFASDPLYQTYSDAGAWIQALSLCVPVDVLGNISISGPQLFSPIPTLYDQQAGGVLMKISQEIVFGIIIGIIFFSWFNKDRGKIDPLPEEKY